MAQETPLSIVYPHNQFLMSGRPNDIMIMKTCHALARMGHPVRIVTGDAGSDREIFAYYGLHPLPQLRIERVPMLRGRPVSWNAVFHLFCLLKILSLRRRGLVDLVYLREFRVARFLLRFRKLLALPFVLEVHDLRIKEFYPALPKRDEREAFVLHRVDAVVVLLNVFGTVLRRTYGVEETKIVKVPLAAEKGPFSPSRPHPRKIGYLGQLYPLQGVDLLIEAMAYLDGAELHIFGGNERDIRRLKGRADEIHVAERIRFHGFVPPHRAADMMRDIDVVVICALNQGKRRYAAHTKLYEYLALGKPIVAFDLPSVSEEVVHAKHALLAEPDNPRSLADNISAVMGNGALAASLAAEAYRLADKFTWEERAFKLSEVFSHVYDQHYR